MPTLFSVAVPEAVLFVHAGEERLDLLHVRDLTNGDHHGRGTRSGTHVHRLEHLQLPQTSGCSLPEVGPTLQAVVAQLLEFADVWLQREDAAFEPELGCSGRLEDGCPKEASMAFRDETDPGSVF